MSKTTAPSGLTISRNGMNFACSWKIAASNHTDGQQFQYKTNLMTSWVALPVGVTATSKTVTLSASSFYPTTKKGLGTVSFRVRGKRRDTGSNPKTYDWSDWSTKTLTINLPKKPTMTAELSDQYNNVSTFSWDTDVSTTDTRPFVNVEYQSILVKESNVTDGSKLKWSSSAQGWLTGTGAASGSRTITEETTILAKNSYTRWVRVRSRGARGASEWRYAKHVYAQPYAAVWKSAKATISGGITTIQGTWSVAASASHPVDAVTISYTIDVPQEGLICPDDATWTDLATIRDTTGMDGWTGRISDAVGTDECMWLRLTTVHDRNTKYSARYVVKAGPLANPSNLTVNASDATHRATIGAVNNSEVPDAWLAVRYRDDKHSAFVIGIMYSGQSSVTVQCPDWSGVTSKAFEVFAFVGDYRVIQRADGVSEYVIKARMTSDIIWQGGNVPRAPQNVVASQSETPGEVILSWDWTWDKADLSEISWSQNPNAWESTEEPQTYTLNMLYTAQWRVSGLETGTIWYFRIRLGMYTAEGETTMGPWSDLVEVDLSSAPVTPVMSLSSAVITESGALTASWAYVTTDGTLQATAEVCLAEIDGDTITYGDIIARAMTAQYADIDTSEWAAGDVYNLCVRVVSASGHVSEWSDPVSVTVAEPLTCTISDTTLETVTVTDADRQSRSVLSLTELPMDVTITGAGTSGITTLIIERAEDYIVDRPDESQFNGYEGETAVIVVQTGESEITISQEELLQQLDDGALYRLVATVQDDLGQSASASMDFEVHWDHQAVVPAGTSAVSGTIATITPVAPSGYRNGDTCDIYRLSVDKPELIVKDGAFGTVYVDPYPAVGGGHRIVYKTENGDYITAGNTFAWIDLDTDYQSDVSLIEFPGGAVELRYNMSLAASWKKAFTETKYLGGSTQGDWNAGFSRTGTIEAVVEATDEEMLQIMRRLAAYTGVCHVRTVDGSSYAADVQVSEDRTYQEAGAIANFSLSITRVDSETLDGMTYSEWVNS